MAGGEPPATPLFLGVERIRDSAMRDRPKTTPVGPAAADALLPLGAQVLQETRLCAQLRRRHLAPVFDLLFRVDRAESPAELLEQEREGVEEGGAPGDERARYAMAARKRRTAVSRPVSSFVSRTSAS
jgi:hypothetical protein